MAAGVGSKVEYLDYNQIQTIINNVFGIGSGNSGYGQTVTSSQVAQHSIVSVTQWNSLRNDLLKARQHQSGVDESGNLGLPTLDIRLSDADRAAYLSMATLINDNRNITPPSGESSFVTLITSNRSSGWTSTVNQTLTIEFGSADNLRWFFNSGGNFQLSSSLTNYQTSGDSALVNSSWETLLRTMGIIKLSNFSTTNTGSGTPATNIGYANLTTSNQLIFSKLVEATLYTPNQYALYAKISGGSALVLTPTWSYTDAGNDGTYRVFEPVTGTLNSFCQMYIATGSNVAVAYPQVQFSGSGWTYSSAYVSPPPSYSMRPNVTLVNEGGTVTYTVSTDNIINGTVLYWKNVGTANGQDFTDTANSGTVTITNNVGIVSRLVRADLTTEFVNETVILQLLTGSINGDLVTTADTVIITDSSLSPISYSITPNTPSQDEGLPIIFTITTTGVANGTMVYWINVGTTSANDFLNGINNGSFAIIGGNASLTRSAEADLTTEGPETIIIELHSASVNGPLLATSSPVNVVDASTTPIVPTYGVAPSINSVSEGNSLILYVTTSNVPSATTLYWTINTNAGDFSTSSGAIVINSNAAQFTVTPTADSTTEGPESFSVSIRTGSTSGQEVAISPTITIGDASTTPAPPPFITSVSPSSRGRTEPFGTTMSSGAGFVDLITVTCTSGSGTVTMTMSPGQPFASGYVSPSSFPLSAGQSQSVNCGGVWPASSLTNPFTWTVSSNAGGSYTYSILRA